MDELFKEKAVIAIQVVLAIVLVVWHYNEGFLHKTFGIPTWAEMLIWCGVVGGLIGGVLGRKGMLWGIVIGAVGIPLLIMLMFAALSIANRH